MQQMITGTANGMPLQTYAPSGDMDDNLENDFGRMARGSAGVAELVALMNWQPWISEAIAKRHSDRMSGHRTLKKLPCTTVHAYEIGWQKGHAQYAQAFLATVLKRGFKVSAAKGRWSASWPLLGLQDPDESEPTNRRPRKWSRVLTRRRI